jgi:hypothetical protein
LAVVDTFLSNLAQQQSASPQQPQDSCLPCADLQVYLLGSDYGATISPNSHVYPRLEEIRSALAKDNDDDNRHILTPEAMQNLPRSKDDDGAIHATCFQLSQEETRGLIATCKAHNCTIQAALNVAFALARLSKLQTPIPCLVPIQIPVNCRGLAVNDNDQSNSCLCGSAGLWQLLEVHPEKMLLSDLAKASTQQMQHDMHAGQAQEWLRRLLNDPASLPPYSLMMSSLGVSPIQSNYGVLVTVKDVLFFGGAQKPHAPSGRQATMVHALTFCNRLRVVFNYLGVESRFAIDLAGRMQTLLAIMANVETADRTVQQALEML